MEKEYSFKILDIKPFIKYLKENNFILKEETNQIRTLYKRKDNIMLRITINEQDNIIKKEFDFKEDKLSNNDYTERKETKSISYEDDEIINSIIDIFNYKKDTELKRKRIVYKKDNIIVEIDSYITPYNDIVFSIEGENIKELYFDIKKELEEYIVKE